MAWTEINGTGETEKIILSGLFGAAVGSLITYFVVRKIERKKVDKEIESVVKAFTETSQSNSEENQLFSTSAIMGIDFNESAWDINKVSPKEEIPLNKIPEIITQEQYTDDDDYDKETIIYYAKNNALADQLDRIVEIEDVIGKENLSYFGKEPLYFKDGSKTFVDSDDPDLLYVRNYDLMTDYEIILDKDKFIPETTLASGEEDHD